MSTALSERPQTVADWLAGHRTLPRLELELLLCRHLAVNRAQLMADPERILTGQHRDRLATDVTRLAQGEPLAYILGERDFWDFTLEVSPAVLIPRPETETLVEEALARLRPGDRVLDLGTGSGAIAIALARAADVDVTAVDSSAEALVLAAANADRLGAHVTFLHSDWFQDVSGTFGVIVANPPYVAEGDPHLDALGFEPVAALTSGPEGLDDLRIIVAAAPAYLADGGWLIVEHGYDQADAVATLFRTAGFVAVMLARDLGGQPRITAGCIKREAAYG